MVPTLASQDLTSLCWIVRAANSSTASAVFALLPFLRAQEPDLILYNGNIWTVDGKQPRAEAVAISSGKLSPSDPIKKILALATGRTKKIDLVGKSVFPGFIDAHAHPADSGREHLKRVACDLPSIAKVTAALRVRADKTPPGDWVLGFLYDDSKTEHPLTRQDLDQAFPDDPVIVYHRGGHIAFANSAAFKAAGVDEHTPDPQGGMFEHGPSGDLTGRVADNAVDIINKVIPPKPYPNEGREAAKLITKMMVSKGVTSVGDAAASPGDLQGYQEARDAGELLIRIYCTIYAEFLDRMIAAGVHTGLGDEWVRVGGIKQFADGSISERTARLSEPDVGIANYYGLFRSSEDELYETGRKPHAAGWQLWIHANGDVAIERVLDVYERIQRESPKW